MDIVRGWLPEGKVCTWCNLWRPLTEFGNAKQYKDGKKYECKSCFRDYLRDYQKANRDKANAWNRQSYSRNRDKWRLRQYGLSPERHDEMLAQQDGRCAICGRTAAESGKKVLSVDHCHASGEVRGLLCGMCNTGLGHFRDNVELLLTAALYLERQRTTPHGSTQA